MRIGGRKLKWTAYVTFLIIILIIVVPIIIKNNIKHNSFEYKLSIKGYNDTQIEQIKELSDKLKDYILENDYNEFIIDLLKEKYFIEDNFMKYLEYHNKLEDYETSHLVAYVNTESYKEPYEDIKEANLDDEYLVLVNKYYYLDKSYSPSNIKNVSNWYAYAGKKLEETTYEAFINLFNNAKEEGLSLVLSNGYRAYKSQQEIFNIYKLDYGERSADEMSTRAGYSEYQTGLALNILKLYGSDSEFETTKEYEWLVDHAHEYGFILRYPKGKEDITKYEFESYHFRYVGVEAATIMYNEDLTLEEYHAYYLK